MTLLKAAAAVDLHDAGRFLPPICDHLSEHGLRVEALDPKGARLRGPGGLGLMRVEPRRLHLAVEAADLGSLLALRAALAAHVAEFAREAAGPIVWTGDGAEATVPAEFRAIRVRSVEQLTPTMRRIRFEAADLARFDTDAHLHCKLLFPPDPARPVWPSLGPDGLIRWPSGRDALAIRKYTIRRLSTSEGWLDVDFVLHTDHGPGSAFATNARPGEILGMIGPGGLGARPAAWTLLAGDETALPAIARVLEAMPPDARGLALIEVAGEAERLPLLAPAGVELRWLMRNGRPAGTTTLLADAVQDVTWPAAADAFAWVGCEMAAFRTVRRHLRQVIGLSSDQHHVVAYWRLDGPEHAGVLIGDA